MNNVSLRDIARVAEHFILRADVAGVFPTPLAEIRRVAGIKDFVDISELPDDITARMPNVFKRILGAYFFKSETAFVDLSQSGHRARFTEGHEIAHKLIPWHEASYYADDETQLALDTRVMLEQEANYGAARLIFQGRRFHERALQYETSLRTPVRLAPEMGASFHATIRYYVEHHPEPLGLLVTGRFGAALPVWSRIHSPEFRRQFGDVADLFPDMWLPLSDPTPYAEVAQAALGTEAFPAVEDTLRDLSGKERACTVEAFTNQRSLFLMVRSSRLIRHGKRLTILSTR